MPELTPIPQPPEHLFGLLGNLPDVNPGDAAGSFVELSKLYGPIFQLRFPGRRTIILGSQELAHAVGDDNKFDKIVSGALVELRDMIGDGLFTAHAEEPNWHLAHKLLMPVFGPVAIRKMFPQMYDIASQLVMKWDRTVEGEAVDTTDNFTRLAFDTIALCAFNYRFNDFYSDNMHPFATWMQDVLLEAGKRANRSSVENAARVWSAEKWKKDIASINGLCDSIIADRKAHPKPEVNDLLNVMLKSRDPETGKGLSDTNIRNQMGTFLIAGHETTSGTLSFALYELLKHPAVLHRARQEVDDVVGDRPITVEDIPKLKYIDAVIKETLRLHSTIRQYPRKARKPTDLLGKYHVEPEDSLLVILPQLHRDPKIWGDDAEEWKPERMLDGTFEKLPPDSWKPFGTGARGCIGSTFALQEMHLVIAMLLQRFTFEVDDPSYELKVQVFGTSKPLDFKIKVKRREDRGDWTTLVSGSEKSTQKAKAASAVSKEDLTPISVLYGSNAGTCKSFADDLEADAASNGFKVTVQTMDAGAEHLPKDQPVVILTPSYEGEPSDNGKVFVSWLESRAGKEDHLKGIKYAVFGAGNSDWVSTFHRIPKLVDDLMSKGGAQRFHEMGLGDVKEDLVGAWDAWKESLWETLRESSGKTHSAGPALSVTVKPSRSSKLLGGESTVYATVRKSYELIGTEVGLAKRHLEVELPKDLTYRSGDYLSVLPFNSQESVIRVLRRFDLSADDEILVSNSTKAFLPTEVPESVFDFLTKSVELRTPATQAQVKKLVAATEDGEEKAQLESYASDEHFAKEVLAKRKAVIDLLDEFHTCVLPFSAYVDMLKPMSPRQYSISSSPISNIGEQNVLSITYDVYDAPALYKLKDGKEAPRFHGVASSYLARVPEGGKIRCCVRKTNVGFQLPTDRTTPVIMICAGTGFAPMRGFLQERAAVKASGNVDAQHMGKAIMYYGCRDPVKDYLYKDEQAQWEKDDIVSVRPTFSKGKTGASDNSAKTLAAEEQATHKYVSERIWAEREELRELFRDYGAKILLCGSANKVGKSVKDTLCKIYKEAKPEASEEDAREWLRAISKERFVSDLFD